MAITYQTEGIKMPDIKNVRLPNGSKAVAATYEKESVKSPIFSVRTKKYWK